MSRAISAQAAPGSSPTSCSGNTDPKQNPIWAEKLELRNGPDGKRRPAAVKTGTTNDARGPGHVRLPAAQPGRRDGSA